MSIRHRAVAVAVIYDAPSRSFLLCHNKRWNGYAFPMKHFEQGRECNLADVALTALDDWYVPLTFSDATATPLDHLVETLRSDAAREVTVYEYHVFDVKPASALPSPLPPELRLFTYDQLQEGINVTSSTKAIARSLVDDRKVAVAVIARSGSTGPEFLLLHNPNHGYFFPSTRIKTDEYPSQCALAAARIDLGFDGPWQVIAEAPEVPALKQSQRFGTVERRFHYQLCLLEAPEVELDLPGNPLESSLEQIAAGANAPAPYWRWATEDQLRNDTTMSRSMPAVLLTALKLVEDRQRTGC